MRYAVEVIADSNGKWNGNALTFGSREDAEIWASDLYARWTSVREWRVIEVDPPYPFCHSPKACSGKGYCPRDPACND